MYSKDEVDKLLKQIEGTLAKIRQVAAENMCHTPKDVGDRVLVWDGSYNEDIKTGEHYPGIHEIFKDYGIITETHCKNILLDSDTKTQKNRDIVVYFPKYDAKVATCMSFVKLYKL